MILFEPGFRGFRAPRFAFFAFLAALFLNISAASQDIPIGVTYICSGEHIYIENCNIRDTSDTSNCMVAHPDHLTPTGLNSYTYVSRGALKKLLPNLHAAQCETSCRSQGLPAKAAGPLQRQRAESRTADESAPAGCLPGRQRRANYTSEKRRRARHPSLRQLRPPALQLHRQQLCSARSGNMLSSTSQLPRSRCTGELSTCCWPRHGGSLPGRRQLAARLHRRRRARQLLLPLAQPGSLFLEIRRRIAPPSSSTPGPSRSTSPSTPMAPSPGRDRSPSRASSPPAMSAEPLEPAPRRKINTEISMTPRAIVSPATPTTATPNSTLERRHLPRAQSHLEGRRCRHPDHADRSAEDSFRRRQGTTHTTGHSHARHLRRVHAASASSSYPESAILGCGPDSARAYPYTVAATASGAQIKVDAPDHPLILAFQPDGSLDPGSTGPYQVHGRIVTGQDDNDDFTFAPMEQTCNLAVLAPEQDDSDERRRSRDDDGLRFGAGERNCPTTTVARFRLRRLLSATPRCR